MSYRPELAGDGHYAAAGFGGFPLDEEGCDGARFHVAHLFEFAAFLAEEDFAGVAEDDEGGHSFLEGNSVARGELEVGVIVADVDVDEDEVRLKDGDVAGVVEVDVEDVAVAAPVSAEVDDDALVGGGGSFEGGGELRAGQGGIGVDVATGRKRGSHREGHHYGDKAQNLGQFHAMVHGTG